MSSSQVLRPLRATSSSDPSARLRQQVTIDDRHSLVVDEPVSLGGTDLGSSPMELIPAAVASCAAITIRTGASARGVDLGSFVVDVQMDRTTVPAHMTVRVLMRRAFGADEEAMIRRVLRGCPVRQLLSPSVSFAESVDLAQA